MSLQPVNRSEVRRRMMEETRKLPKVDHNGRPIQTAPPQADPPEPPPAPVPTIPAGPQHEPPRASALQERIGEAEELARAGDRTAMRRAISLKSQLLVQRAHEYGTPGGDAA